MRKDFHATALERAIGRTLREWRDELGLSLTEAGARAGFSSAKLSMMENAVWPSPTLDIMALGYVYKVPGSAWQLVVVQAELAQQLREKKELKPRSFVPADDLPLLLADATLLRVFTTDVVPSVFQINPYTVALASVSDPLQATRLAHAREAWTARFDRDDPIAVEAVFPEAVLTQVVGGERVMKAQLLHLMEMSVRRSVSIRIVPREAGAYPAMGCPFTWLSFPHRLHDDVVYLETVLRGEYAEDPNEISQVSHRFGALRNLALSDGESMELIAEIAAGL